MHLCRATLLIALLLSGEVQAEGYPGHLRRIDSLADWDSIALGSSGIKHVVPGPSPVPGPDGEQVPGDPQLPCLDFVLYGPPIQHIDIILSTGLDCLADFDNEKMNQMRTSMRQFAGSIARLTGRGNGRALYGVSLHNDLFTGPPEISPQDVSYVIRQIRRSFNEEALGRVVYLPIWSVAQERARRWLSDPALTLDFEVYFSSAVATPRFLRGDANGDGELLQSDAITLFYWLFVDEKTPLPCKDAADADDDGGIGLPDPLLVLRYLFLGGSEPAPPFPGSGPDPTADELGDC